MAIDEACTRELCGVTLEHAIELALVMIESQGIRIINCTNINYRMTGGKQIGSNRGYEGGREGEDILVRTTTACSYCGKYFNKLIAKASSQ
jgi:hypothetical protein